MPVEIRELIVKATVRANAPSGRAARPAQATPPSNERALLREVMRVLRDKQER